MPVIGVPTSVDMVISQAWLLLAMLTPVLGLTVVNIDNGFDRMCRSSHKRDTRRIVLSPQNPILTLRLSIFSYPVISGSSRRDGLF